MNIKTLAKRVLTNNQLKTIKAKGHFYKSITTLPAKISLKSKNNLNIHLGCGFDKIIDYINIDVMPTKATDCVANLNSINIFSPESVRTVYSHAFFEHLLKGNRVNHLLKICDCLSANNGVIAYIGLPDFKKISSLYLKKAKGIYSETFDLDDVYRFTHGDPDECGYYFEQLHKSLFDTDEIVSLLNASNFNSYVVFNYAYPNEDYDLNLGFVASKQPNQKNLLSTRLQEILDGPAQNRIQKSSVNIILENY